ncbi:hypothetical protein ACHAXT_010335 [Thalassiosira profunda]
MSSLPTPCDIKIIAREHGYVERREEASNTLFFKDNKPSSPTLINVFYTTGGVMTKLSHPKTGYNELWRSDAYASEEGLSSIFKNPRVHTGQGYRHTGDAKRGCVQCGMQKKKDEYSKNQWRKGAGNAKCTSCTQQGQQQGDAAKVVLHPSDIYWNAINDAITCDAEGCNKTSPTVHKYLALSRLAKGDRDMAIISMKEAVLYEAPWSDETIRANKELLCELMNGRKKGNTQNNAGKGKGKGQTSDEKKLEVALRQLRIAGGREEEPGSDDEDVDDDPKEYLNELLAVADARFNLGQYSKAASLYYRGYYAAMHSGSCINNPATFPIAHKMIQAMIKSGEEHNLKMAHGMAQQTMMMPGHPAYIRQDLVDVEKVMAERGMQVERDIFGMMGGMGGFGF